MTTSTGMGHILTWVPARHEFQCRVSGPPLPRAASGFNWSQITSTYVIKWTTLTDECSTGGFHRFTIDVPSSMLPGNRALSGQVLGARPGEMGRRIQGIFKTGSTSAGIVVTKTLVRKD